MSIKVCLKRGARGGVARQVKPNDLLELYGLDCEVIGALLWRERALVDTSATHDLDSD